MKPIVISGPESSGKSTLTIDLANYFRTRYLAEYARDYVERLKRPYTITDVETIARRQVAQFRKMESLAKSDDIVFFDTFLVITKVWFQEVYKLCPIWLNAAIKKYRPNLVLLCKPDLDWIHDGVRENRENREYLFNCYRDELNYYGFSYHIIDGFGNERLEKSVYKIKQTGLIL